MAVDLIERITNAPRLRYQGAGYRQQAPAYDPLSGEGARIHGGRFNPPDSFPVLYLCSTPGCAAAEFMRTTQRHPLGPTAFLPRVLYRYDVQLTAVLDLTDAGTLEHLGLEPGALMDEDVTLPRHIGEIGHKFGYQAIHNASAAGVDDVVAVLVENLRTGVLTPSLEETWTSLDDIPLL
ncbi:MAG: RES domain-containing protein [Acidimicrobiales bacterium]